MTFRPLLSLVALAALTACGGGGSEPEGASSAASAGQDPSQRSAVIQSFFPTGVTIPVDANVKGMWSPVYSWPHVAVHTVVLPDGRVLTYGAEANGLQGGTRYDVWEGSGAPNVGHTTLANPGGTSIFCSTQILLPGTSNVFVGGGDAWSNGFGSTVTNQPNNNSNIYTGSTNGFARASNMNRPRWYAASTTLTNGEIYIQGGLGGSDLPEIRSASGVFRLLSTNTSDLDYYYPHNYVTSDGRVFGFDSLGKMYYVDASTGTRSNVGQFASSYAGSDTTSAMFRPGRILHFGGNGSGALVIDVSAGGTPVVKATQSLSSQRRLASATVLADGKVLATGGSSTWNSLTGVNNKAEIWNPTTGLWTQGYAGNRARLYHSGAVLLPDASVLVLGGGANSPTTSAPQNNNNVEIYYPPYLFAANGVRAVRPTLSAAPMALEIGKVFNLTVGASDSIQRVTLVKTSSTTHARNLDQRFIELTFSASGNQLQVQAPTKAGDATPGAYMLFVHNAAGVPSEAKMVSIGVAANPNPSTAPVLGSPGNQASTVGGGVSLGLNGSDPNGDALRYGAAGLPPGLSLNSSSGAITGTPTTAGSYSVTATATDGVNTASASFQWQVNNPAPLTLTSFNLPVAVASSGSVSYSAGVSGGVSPQYSWNFGDGSAATAWSSSANIQYTYARPGSYTVTFTAQDARGEVLTRSFLQTVYLPPTAGRPSASSALALEKPATGNARLWVVNPDNDSVTAFDAVTRAKLGEVATGAAPRSVAVAQDGQIWVVNKRADTVSVINPATRAVTRTLNLPRGSLPFGVAMSPTTPMAYVALEGTGSLLALHTATFATVGSVAVGPNPRHVSVSADGSRILVSRFISPPLPGEGGGVVTPTLSTGGEVVQLNAATLSVTRTTVLRVSDAQDGEASGRGLPNYLGAAVISPDGSQAWVPSKIDNVQRGTLRDGLPLNFQNTVRAAASRIDMATGTEDYSRRLDLDNASMASSAVYDALGVYLFVALETSREVAVIDAHAGRQLMRIPVGRAPEGLALSADGRTLFVHHFMDRSVGAYDLRPLLDEGLLSAPVLATLPTVATEKLSATVLKGKQFFYDAKDTRLARDSYMSCASCHNDGGHDGRVWDLTGLGEGLRNTIALRGRAAMGQGRLHWSANFDELQDFEGQIRVLAGGSGLMADADFTAGTRSTPLGDPKAGRSADLDALAAYVTSLASFDKSPLRNTDGSLTATATAGRTVFAAQCASCHSGAGFTDSAGGTLHDVGTIKTSSGTRLGGPLTGLDTPTLRDVWATGPYLHDGSAATIETAIGAHRGLSLSAADLTAVAAFTRQIGSEEAAVTPVTPPAPGGSSLVVRARGSLVAGVGPLIEVRHNGTLVGTRAVNNTAADQDYSFTTTVAAVAGDRIDVVFTNDAYAAPEDRNLFVASVKVDGTALPIGSGQIDIGDGAAAFDGLDLVAGDIYGGWIPWAAALRLQVPAVVTPPPGGGTATTTLRAQGTLAAGVGPEMSLRINGTVYGGVQVGSTSLQNYSFPNTPVLKAGDKVEMVFTNDAVIAGEDRNVFIASLSQGSVTLQPSDSGALIDKGAGAAAFDGLDTEVANIYGGWFPWSGAMRFTVAGTVPPPSTNDTVVVNASATLAGGVGAQMSLVVNGVSVGTQTVNATSPQAYTFATPTIVAGDRIDVVFSNDEAIGAEDRNLIVQSVQAHGATLSPGDAGATFDIGSGSAAFDGLSTVGAGAYGGWMPWNGAMRWVAR